jgi:hypothetical protein
MVEKAVDRRIFQVSGCNEGRPDVGVRSSSLLRLVPTARGLPLVVVVVCATAGAGIAQAAGQAPDPSPSLSAVHPDPYPAPTAPATRPSTPARTQAPVTIVVRPTVVRTPVHPSSVVRRKPQPAVKPKAAVKPILLPVHPAPGLGARFATAAVAFEPQQRVSRTLALAVALLVLVSAAFVAGAAREVAR